MHRLHRYTRLCILSPSHRYPVKYSPKRPSAVLKPDKPAAVHSALQVVPIVDFAPSLVDPLLALPLLFRSHLTHLSREAVAPRFPQRSFPHLWYYPSLHILAMVRGSPRLHPPTPSHLRAHAAARPALSLFRMRLRNHTPLLL